MPVNCMVFGFFKLLWARHPDAGELMQRTTGTPVGFGESVLLSAELTASGM